MGALTNMCFMQIHCDTTIQFTNLEKSNSKISEQQVGRQVLESRTFKFKLPFFCVLRQTKLLDFATNNAEFQKLFYATPQTLNYFWTHAKRVDSIKINASRLRLKLGITLMKHLKLL